MLEIVPKELFYSHHHSAFWVNETTECDFIIHPPPPQPHPPSPHTALSMSAVGTGYIRHCELSDNPDTADTQVERVAQAAYTTFDPDVIERTTSLSSAYYRVAEEKVALLRQREEAVRHIALCDAPDTSGDMPAIGRGITLAVGRTHQWGQLQTHETKNSMAHWEDELASVEASLGDVDVALVKVYDEMLAVVSAAYAKEGTAAQLPYYAPHQPTAPAGPRQVRPRQSHCKKITRLLLPMNLAAKPERGKFVLSGEGGGSGGGGGGGSGTQEKKPKRQKVKRKKKKVESSEIALPTISMVLGQGGPADLMRREARLGVPAACRAEEGGLGGGVGPGVAGVCEQMRVRRGLAITPNHSSLSFNPLQFHLWSGMK